MDLIINTSNYLEKHRFYKLDKRHNIVIVLLVNKVEFCRDIHAKTYIHRRNLF